MLDARRGILDQVKREHRRRFAGNELEKLQVLVVLLPRENLVAVEVDQVIHQGLRFQRGVRINQRLRNLMLFLARGGRQLDVIQVVPSPARIKPDRIFSFIKHDFSRGKLLKRFDRRQGNLAHGLPVDGQVRLLIAKRCTVADRQLIEPCGRSGYMELGAAFLDEHVALARKPSILALDRSAAVEHAVLRFGLNRLRLGGRTGGGGRRSRDGGNTGRRRRDGSGRRKGRRLRCIGCISPRPQRGRHNCGKDNNNNNNRYQQTRILHKSSPSAWMIRPFGSCKRYQQYKR